MMVDAPVEGSALMVGEAHHRFFNSLQLIVSATSGIMRKVSDPLVRESLEALQAQVVLLAEINRQLAGPFGPESISVGALERLCAALVASFERTNTVISVSVAGDALPPDRCRIFLLLLSELLMNALKHGGLEQKLRVRISLTANDDRCRLTVCSNTAVGSHAVGRPRIAAELAELAGGTLDTHVVGGEFGVVVIVPNRAKILGATT